MSQLDTTEEAANGDVTEFIQEPSSRVRQIVLTALAIFLALFCGALLIWAAGGNPFVAYADMVKGVFTSPAALSLVMGDVVPLLTIGLGLMIAFRAKIWNIGAEGQFLLGALFGGAFAIYSPIEAPIFIIPMTLLVGTLAGAAWGWIVGILRARWGVNEVITSLLMVYVAGFIVVYAIRQPMRDPEYFLPQSAALPKTGRLGDIPWLDVHAGLVIALALVPLTAYLINRTSFGIRSLMFGYNPDGTRAAGVNTSKLTVRIMLLSGGLAGLAGIMQVMGAETRITNNISPGFGFTAIIVALLGRLRPLGVFLAAVLIGVLNVGGDALQRSQGLPRAVVVVIQALFVIFLLIAERTGSR
jgi:ABC-type uncharacterized transport system permease subunit